MKTGIVLHTLTRIERLLTPSQKKRGLVLMLAILTNALLEVLGLAAILPILAVAVDPGLIQSNEYLSSVYTFFSFRSEDQFLLSLVLLMFGLFLFKNLLGAAIIYFQSSFSMQVATHLSKRSYLFYMQKGYQKIKNIDSGNYITNVRSVPNFFAQNIMVPMVSILSEMVVLLIIIVGIAAYQFQLVMILALVMGSAVLMTNRLTRKRALQIGSERKVLIPKLVAMLNETIHGYIDIHIFNRVKFFMEDFMKNKKRENHLIKWQVFLRLIPSKINEIIAVLGIVIVFLYCLFFAEKRQELLILLSVFATSAYRIMPTLNRMMSALVSIKSYLYTLDILEELDQVTDMELMSQEEQISFEQNIVFQSVGFSFEDSETPVLDDISFQVKKGKQIGLIGVSGSGKTTLMRILLRLFKEGEGTISIDGIPISKTNEQSWIEKIGFVQQHVFIRDASLLENVAFGYSKEEADQDKAKQALELASLGPFLKRLPEGLETPMGEFGSKLSGGQRQRVAIARALYKDAEVFVFDEATSALDPKTEQMITESIKMLAENGKTVFLIAHRFTTLQACDYILELEKGKIVRTYQYDELLKDKLGLVQDPS